MKRTSLFLTLVLFGVPVLQAAELCTPQELEHPSIKARARIVHLPGERSITLLGHVHGERRSLSQIAGLAKDPQDEIDNDQWREDLQAVIKQNEQALVHAKQDLGFLRARLWEAQQPLFLAIEIQDRDVLGYADKTRGVSLELSSAYWQRGLEDIQLLRDLELTAMGGVLYSYHYDSELRDTYQLVGIEDTLEGARLQRQGKKKMQIGEKRLAVLKAKQGLDEELTTKTMALVVDQMNKAYDDIADILAYDQETIRRQIVREHRHLDPQVRGAVLHYLYGYLDYLRGMKKRDVFSARKLVRQERSGIFVFGEKHLESIAKLLEMECRLIKPGKKMPEDEVKHPEIGEM